MSYLRVLEVISVCYLVDQWTSGMSQVSLDSLDPSNLSTLVC